MTKADSIPPDSDRRRHPRCLVCTPVEVKPEPSTFEPIEDHKAVIRDISVSGASFLTRVPLDQEDRLDLTIYLSRDEGGDSIKTGARVVRVEHFEPERADVWTCQIAVAFDQPLDGHEQAIEELGERLRKAGLPW